MPLPKNRDFLREGAERCLRLARSFLTAAGAQMLTAMANVYFNRAGDPREPQKIDDEKKGSRVSVGGP